MGNLLWYFFFSRKVKRRRSECCCGLGRPPGECLDLWRLPATGQESVVMIRGRGLEARGHGGQGGRGGGAQGRGGERLGRRQGHRGGHQGGHGGDRGRGEGQGASHLWRLGLLRLGGGLPVDRHNSFVQ